MYKEAFSTSFPEAASEMPDYSQPTPGEDASSKRVVDFQMARYRKLATEGRLGEFGEELPESETENDIKRKKGERVVNETVDLAALNDPEVSKNIREQIADMGIEKIADLDVLLDTLKQLEKSIGENSRLSNKAKANFQLDPEYNYTLSDLITELGKVKNDLQANKMSDEQLELVPLTFPDTYGVRKAVEKCVENILNQSGK